MKRITRYFFYTAACLMVSAKLAAQSQPAWPHVIPARIADGTNSDLFMMTLGDVQTPLADGTFDPVKDQVTLKDGTIKSNYYRDTLGVRYYQPIDKTRFPLPPSGWCTWYYYYGRIDAGEVKSNAKWIAENLKQFGAQYVQIDDGWQGGTGRGNQRDWTTVNAQHFPNGMADTASYIKSLGLTAGLWLAPHGQSNPNFVKTNNNVFLLKADGTSPSSTWEGTFLVDPSTPESAAYLKALFTKLVGWGFDYFKIDGQPIVVDEYGLRKQFLKNPSDDPAELYRKTLAPIREAIGPDRYLLGCWGLPVQGANIMNGSRTGGDVVLGWGGFQVALHPTMESYYQHNIVWYTDPDVVLVRSPLTLDQARVWASIDGLTGQAVMSSDRLPDLSEERVELLRRVFPATDIRPLDLYPTKKYKATWDLKVNHLGRHYDVVGAFNFDSDKATQKVLRWSELGLADDKPVHVFDFWNGEYLGAWSQGFAVPLSPTSCRVLTLLPDNGHIQLISTSRHITQGWVDLKSLQQNDADNSFAGTSEAIANDPYELRFAFPRGSNYVVQSVSARAGSQDLSAQILNHQGWAAVRWKPSTTVTVTWKVTFAPSTAPDFHYPPSAPEGIHFERAGLSGVDVTWPEQYYLNAGYNVYLNNQLLSYTPTASFPIRNLNPQTSYTVLVKSVGDDGRESQQGARTNFTTAALAPNELPLATLEPRRATGQWRGDEVDEMLPTGSLSLGGKRHEGLRSFAGSETEFDLFGLYQKFTAVASLDSTSHDDVPVEFVVLGDDKELWHSKPARKADAAQPVDLDITGVRRLVLRTLLPETKDKHPQADWADAKIAKNQN
jgi:NPCBM/NEW2 domain/Melibiase